MALDLRSYGHDCALSQRVRPGVPVLREGAGPESDGSQAIGAAIPGRPVGGDGDIHRAYYFCGEKVPPGHGTRVGTVNRRTGLVLEIPTNWRSKGATRSAGPRPVACARPS